MFNRESWDNKEFWDEDVIVNLGDKVKLNSARHGMNNKHGVVVNKIRSLDGYLIHIDFNGELSYHCMERLSLI